MSAQLLLRFILWPWIGAAVYAGHTLFLQRVPPIAVPAIVLLLATMALMAYLRLTTLRTWIDALDVRRLMLLHVSRFVGIAFLLQHQRGEMPYAFAVPAGIGDIAIAALALIVAFAPLTEAARRRAISIWNMAGLFDLLFVVATAARLTRDEMSTMRALTELPLSLWPTFLVPLLIATHVIILMRLSRPTLPA